MAKRKNESGSVTSLKEILDKRRAPFPKDIQIWKQQLVNGVLRSSTIVVALLLVGGSYYAYSTGALWLIPLYVTLIGLWVLVTYLPKTPYAVQAWSLLLLIYAVSILDFFESGRTGSGRVFLIALPVLSLLLFDVRAGLLTLGVSLLTLGVFGWLYVTARLSVSSEVANSTSLAIWLSNSAVFSFTAVLLMVSANYLINRLVKSVISLEASVRQTEDLLSLQQAVFDSTTDGILAVDRTGKITTFNRKFVELWGIPEALMASRDDEALIAVVLNQMKDPTEFKTRVKALYEHPQEHSDDLLELKDGRVLERYSRPQWLEGEIVGRVWVFRDITAQKQVEETLRQSQRNFDLFFNTMDDLLFVLDDKGSIIHVNQTVCRKLGYTEAELIGQPVLVVHPPEQQADAGRIVAEMLGGEAEFCPVPVVTKDGRQIPVETRVFMGEWDGRPALFGVTRDISQLKLSEETLARERNLLRAVVDTLPDSVFAKDVVGRKILSNLGDQRVMGVHSEAEALGKTDWDVYPPELAAKFAAEDRPVLQEGVLFESEDSFVEPTGQRRWVLGSKRPFRNQAGDIIGLVGIYRDITHIKQAEAEREALIVDLEAKNAELERFTYTVSHDLKSPLITIKGFLGFLKQDIARGDADRLDHDIKTIGNATDKMQQLLDELLELSRIGRLVNPPQRISMSELAQEAAEMVAGQLNARGVHVEIAPNMPTVVGDRPRLLEVWQNLLSNAAKFMGDQPHPRIEIGTRTEEDDETVFYVRDNGIGISPQYQEKVFGLFEKLDPNSEGTGIGLAIVKRIVETHGGRIWVESKRVGHGSTFCFTLAQPPEQTKPS